MSSEVARVLLFGPVLLSVGCGLALLVFAACARVAAWVAGPCGVPLSAAKGAAEAKAKYGR
jgi:hypothetical protein